MVYQQKVYYLNFINIFMHNNVQIAFIQLYLFGFITLLINIGAPTPILFKEIFILYLLIIR